VNVRDDDEPPEIREAIARLSPRDRGLVRAVVRAVAPVLASHERRLNELAERPHLHEEGVWQPETAYGVGAVVTDHGSAWVAKQPTCQRPGINNDHWRLLVKRGRDGKDARRLVDG